MTETIGCAEAVRRLWAHLDDGLDAADRDGLEAHLARCLRCCGELAFARELRAMLAQRTAAEVPTDVRDRLEGFIDTLGDPSSEAVDR